MQKALCFILMPFGKKPGIGGTIIDFDSVYSNLIKPSVEAADLIPLRADEEITGGIIHKPMFERLILCEFAVADLTTANANVFYELGLRHAVRPASTVLIFAQNDGQIPFDVGLLRAIPYQLTPDGKPADTPSDRNKLTDRLREARKFKTDSPVFQLVEGFPDIQRLRTDVFRDQVEYSTKIRQKLAAARKEGAAAVEAVERKISPISDAEAGVVIDLFLSYRAVKAWNEMISLVEKMATPLSATILVQEQLALALNRAGRGDEAERVLLSLISSRGPSSETYGILGRVYKDRWEAAAREGDRFLARGLLDRAIQAYLKGFEADWRDAYPGINAITLMEIKDPPDPRRDQLLPVVTYAVERRIVSGNSDYWDHATLLELATLGKDEKKARSALCNALVSVRESWEAESTAHNLRLIREARERRGERIEWVEEVERTLQTVRINNG